jgi:hypothetical protein
MPPNLLNTAQSTFEQVVQPAVETTVQTIGTVTDKVAAIVNVLQSTVGADLAALGIDTSQLSNLADNQKAALLDLLNKLQALTVCKTDLENQLALVRQIIQGILFRK